MKGTKLSMTLLHFLKAEPSRCLWASCTGTDSQGARAWWWVRGSCCPGAYGQGRSVGASGAGIRGGGGRGVGTGTHHCPSGTPPRHLSPWVARLRTRTGLDPGIRLGLLAPKWWSA